MLRALTAGTRYFGEKGQLDALDPRPLPDAELLERIREEALETEVGRLHEPFRTPLLLYVEGHSDQEIAESTQTVGGTGKSRICRGKAILRRRLRAYL